MYASFTHGPNTSASAQDDNPRGGEPALLTQEGCTLTEKVGLYFRRRRAFTRLSNARESVNGVPVYTSHGAVSARQRASESVARRQMQQSSTVLNFRASRQRTPAILPIMYRCHELSLQRIELALTSVSSILGNQLVASESQRASDHGQRAVVTPRVKLSLSFLSPFSRYLINFIHKDS